MAEYPEQIKKLFETHTVNESGIYMLKLYVNGMLTPVIVDDYVPVTARGNLFACTTKSSEIYAILLEKAWAKLHGSYARIESGLPSFATMHLTGAPSDSFWHGNIKEGPDMFWEKMRRCDKFNYLMIAASHG